MGPVSAAAATGAAAVGSSVAAGNVVGAAVGMIAGVGTFVGGADAAPPQPKIPARSAARAKADFDRSHRYISKF